MIVILYLWTGSDTSIILFHTLLCTHVWPKHVAGHCIHKLISLHMCAFVGTAIVCLCIYIYIKYPTFCTSEP
jgi:hypothetical protein